MESIQIRLMHVKLLLIKNLILSKRNLRNTIILFISPIVIVLLMLFWQFVYSELFNFLEIEGEINNVPKLSKCYKGSKSSENNCEILTYAVIGKRELWTEYVINYVAKTNDLDLNRDIKFLGEM